MTEYIYFGGAVVPISQAPITLNAIAFGAIADNATDCTAAFNAAISAAQSQGGGDVVVPASGVQYRVVGPINLGNNVRFRGCGQSGTVRTKLRHDASAPGSVLMLADQGGLMSGVAVSNFIISTPNNLQTFSIRLRDCVYSEISDLLIGAANLVEKNVAIHLQTMTAIIPTMGFITIRNISTTSLEANSGW